MENNIVLNPKDIFSFAFTNAKKHFWSFFIVMICFVAIEILKPNKSDNAFESIRALIAVVASIYLSISMMNAVLEIVNGQEVKTKNFFTWPKNGYKMIWAGLVSGLCIVPFFLLGMLVFFIPGAPGLILILIVAIAAIYASFRLMFTKYRALDVGSGPVESIKYSFDITKDRVLQLIWLSIIMLGIYLLGVIALLVGLLWAIPTVVIAQVLIYKTLTGGVNNSSNIVNNLPEIQPVELSANTSVAHDSATAQN